MQIRAIARVRHIAEHRVLDGVGVAQQAQRLIGMCGADHRVDIVFAAVCRQHHAAAWLALQGLDWRSEEHTSELQSLMRNSYAVFCLKKKNRTKQHNTQLN